MKMITLFALVVVAPFVDKAQIKVNPTEKNINFFFNEYF